jgi:hypothetical protein
MATPHSHAPSIGDASRHVVDSAKDGQDDVLKVLNEEVEALRTANTTDGRLDRAAFHDQLSDFEKQLRADSRELKLKGILPNLDLIDSENGDVRIATISGDGDVHDNNNGKLITKARGREFEYDRDGHITEWSENKGKDVWKLGEDGQFHLYRDGEKTDRTKNVIAQVDEKGNFILTNNENGSSTTFTRGGLTVKRDSDNRITQYERKDFTRNFHYGEDGALDRVTTHDGDNKTEYSKDADGHFYCADDKDKKNPLDISVSTEPGHNGAVLIKDINKGTSREEFPHGAVIDRKEVTVNGQTVDQIQHIHYANGKEADFKYNEDGSIKEYSTTDKGGTKHKYEVDGDKITLDGKPLGTGTLTVDDRGRVKLEGQFKLEDGTEASTITFKRSGAIIAANADGNPVEITNAGGRVNKFEWQDGQLVGANAYGFDLEFKDGKWVMKDGKPSLIVPSVDEQGNFTLTDRQGFFTSWTAAGSREQGEPETAAGNDDGNHPGWVTPNDGSSQESSGDQSTYDGEVVDSGDYKIMGPPSISPERFAEVLKDSPAAKDANEIYNYCVAKGVDPAIALAFFHVESSYGTAGIATETKNWGNLRPHDWSDRPIGESGGFSSYATWADGAKDFVDLMVRSYSDKSLGAALIVYAPPSDGNDPAAYAQTVENVVADYRQGDRWA